MPIFRVKEAGGKGVIKDLPSFELPPGAWSDSKNVRFNANRIEKMGGYYPAYTEDKLTTEAPLSIMTRNTNQAIIYGTSSAIYSIEGRTHTNISQRIKNPEYNPDTNPDVPTTIFKTYNADPENKWYYTTLSNSIVMNNPRDTPQGLRPGDTNFVELPGWGWPSKNNRPTGAEGETPPAQWQAGRIRSYKNYLIALDMTEGVEVLPQRIRWSNASYVNALPPDWIEDDETRDGGFNDLSDANGRIVDGVPLRDSLVIYTDQETYLMDYVGGALVFQFKKLFNDSGALAPECVAEFEQKHFVISKDDIFVHNGSSKQPVASGRVKRFLIEEIASVNPQATKVFAYTTRKEIWITYVGSGQTDNPLNPAIRNVPWKCDKCAIWNWEWDTWYFYDIPANYDFNMCPPPDVETLAWEDFQGNTDIPPESQPDIVDWWGSPTWITQQWSSIGRDFINRVPYVAGADGAFYVLDSGEYQLTWEGQGIEPSQQPVIAEMLRTHLDMDEAVENTRAYKFIRRVVPQVRGYGTLSCSVGGSLNSSQEPDWDNYQLYDIELDDKIDAYSNNRYPAIRFLDYGPGEWSMTGYDIDFVVEGSR